MALPEAREVNVEGTQRMLEFAQLAQERGGLRRYAQVSTAYVAGTHDGSFSESDLDVGQEFRNSYEQSKFEAEQLVRTHGAGLPWMILRPSIVVGDRRSGWTAAFNVLYWPLRAFSTGLFKTVPANPASPLDVVSIDYVADAIHELCESPGVARETFHLTASAQASTMGELATLASSYFRLPLPQVVPPSDLAAVAEGLSDAALESSRVYFPYFSIGTVFDNAKTRARLAPAGIQASPLHDYLERLLDFATRSRWGKRPIGRAEALAP
jgi:long-chain acyl-CoA synthetase